MNELRVLLVVFLAVGASSNAVAQSLPGLTPTTVAASNRSPDTLGRDTPRSAMRAFLDACHNERYVQASLYLDLQNMPAKRRNTEGPELARDLGDLLDRDAGFDVNQLSDSPEGSRTDGLHMDRDRLATSEADGRRIELYLERKTRANGEIWLVSQDSVAKLADLTTNEQVSPLERKLPEGFVKIKFLGTSLWIWLALLLAALVLSLISRLLSRLVLWIYGAIAKRYLNRVHSNRLAEFVEPLRLLVWVSVFRAVIDLLNPSALLRDYLLKFLLLLFAFGAASLVVRIIDVVLVQIQGRLSMNEQALMCSVLPLAGRVLRVVVFCAFFLMTLSGWGYNTNAILAGVGVGGLAVALAAQKTIENLFGGFSLISDRPVLVGDFCRFGAQVGTVEDIGLRSTRIRTLDRTLVTIPNGQFSTMTLENFSRRDRIWFHPALRIRRDTPAHLIPQFVQKITDVLKANEMVSVGEIPLRFSNIEDQALNIDVFAYVLTNDYDKFVEVQNQLLLEFLKVGETSGVSFAIPIVESLNRTMPQEPPGVEPASLDRGSGTVTS